MGILLSRIKAEPKEIKNAIKDLNEETLSLDNSRALMRLAPSSDEVKEYLITNHSTD